MALSRLLCDFVSVSISVFYLFEFFTWFVKKLVVFGSSLFGAGFMAVGARREGVVGDVVQQAFEQILLTLGVLCAGNRPCEGARQHHTAFK